MGRGLVYIRFQPEITNRFLGRDRDSAGEDDK